MPTDSSIQEETLAAQAALFSQQAIAATTSATETITTFFSSSLSTDIVDPISQAENETNKNNIEEIIGESLNKQEIIEFNNISINYFPHNNINRKYLIYIPKSYDGSENYPLIFNFHSPDSNAESQFFISDMRDLAERCRSRLRTRTVDCSPAACISVILIINLHQNV